MKLVLVNNLKHLGYFHNKYYSGPWENAMYIATSDHYLQRTNTERRKVIIVDTIEIDEYKEKNWL